ELEYFLKTLKKKELNYKTKASRKRADIISCRTFFIVKTSLVEVIIFIWLGLPLSSFSKKITETTRFQF
ncbi:hypothetical protein, partial [Klebsiella pneumoniae]|uniref:hypothetical protein n=1 Tax=Klebsiella pneumoniae TaxID=573 RepID=UPI0030140B49